MCERNLQLEFECAERSLREWDRAILDLVKRLAAYREYRQSAKMTLDAIKSEAKK